MACAIPVVASPVGVNVDIVSSNHCGVLANSHEQWTEALSRLLAVKQDRIKLGQAGRQAVEMKYSLQAQAPILEALFHSLSTSK
ncbi:D-inositol-3-phosphate glycosyltransferase [compost metagenome]